MLFQRACGYYIQRKPFEDAYFSADMDRKRCQNAFFGIHKALHPFLPDGRLTDGESVRSQLSHSLSQLGKLADKIGLDVPLEKFSAMLDLVPDWLRAIQCWQDWAEARLRDFLPSQAAAAPPEQLGRWLLAFFMPALHWQMTLLRTPQKARYKRLRAQYRQWLREARARLFRQALTEKLDADARRKCLRWAARTLSLFQRSSSQVEGRNGALGFFHRAARRFGPQRLQALTVVHNFDTRRADGTSAAERLFDRHFPDLFEFILADLSQIPPHSKRTPKQRDFWDVRA